MEALKRTCRHIRDLIAKETGQDMIEYALLVALVALGVTAALASLGAEVGQAFHMIARSVRHDFFHHH